MLVILAKPTTFDGNCEAAASVEQELSGALSGHQSHPNKNFKNYKNNNTSGGDLMDLGLF